MLEKSRKVGLKSTEYQIIRLIKKLTFQHGFHVVQTIRNKLILCWLRMVHRKVALWAQRLYRLFLKQKRLVCDSYLRQIGICLSEIRVASYLCTLVLLGGHYCALTRAQQCPSLGIFLSLRNKNFWLAAISLISLLQKMLVVSFIKIFVVDF